MAFNSDKQRKAFFAKQGKPRSNIVPSISGKIKGIRERLRQRRERLGRERIEKEKILLRHEQEQVARLRKEAEVESQRERIAQQRIESQRKLKVIEKARFERKIAPVKAGIRKTITGYRKVIEAEQKIEKAVKKFK